ncbi:hypothetical protein OPV22_022487 [Ensete ventricosum]|uniref:Uncharacterized protein n=1 Tax=Ensete ventricosum TaxID=4639 RepID=A0AAV8PC16_ENSVE|nr:hypothetical protein OPV22_022487 [Ensete ventricosum]
MEADKRRQNIKVQTFVLGVKHVSLAAASLPPWGWLEPEASCHHPPLSNTARGGSSLRYSVITKMALRVGKEDNTRALLPCLPRLLSCHLWVVKSHGWPHPRILGQRSLEPVAVKGGRYSLKGKPVVQDIR